MDHLHTRLNDLERRHRRVCTGFAVAIAALASLAAFRQDPIPAVLRAEAVEIVDGEGKVRARFAIEDGGPRISMTDAEDRERIRLGLQSEGVPAVFLSDAQSQRRVVLICDETGIPYALLSRKGGKPAAMLTVSERGSPSLVFTSLEGEHNAGIGLDPDGAGWILPER